MSPITIAGAGCALIDHLYRDVDFNGEAFRSLASRKKGDGGLVPGRLVFTEELEAFARLPLAAIIERISGKREADSSNLGGPAIVALINAAQLLYGRGVEVSYHGTVGDDEAGRKLRSIVGGTPVNIDHYRVVVGSSPFTNVLSDPSYNRGHGERTFINNIGAAWQMLPGDLGPDFFAADIVLFGATALVPRLHDGLTPLLKRKSGGVTVVSTVYDFRSERANPHRRWPLGSGDESYRHVDLLATDREEALRLSGTSDMEAAVSFFKRRGLSAFIATDGPQPIRFFSDGRLFGRTEGTMPVSDEVARRLRVDGRSGDTTGCGDNFVGGVIASIAAQLARPGRGELDLREAAALGVVSGGFACFYLGGTYLEERPGEKLRHIARLYEAYRAQVSGEMALGEPLWTP